MSRFSLGFDFGTESCRVLIVDIQSGRIAGQDFGGVYAIDSFIPKAARRNWNSSPQPAIFDLQSLLKKRHPPNSLVPEF